MQLSRETFHRYFLKQVSDTEKETIHQWLEANEAHKKEFIRERIYFDAVILSDEKYFVASKPKVMIPAWAKYGISAAVTIVVMLLCFNRYNQIQSEKLAKVYQTIQVPAGNYSTHIILSDGTKV